MTAPGGRSLAERSLASVDAVWEWLDGLGPLGAEAVPVVDAADRVVAAPLTTAADVPSEARAGCDGYALRAADTVGASTYNPLPLSIQGARVSAATARRVDLGMRLPNGTDAVAPVDACDERGRILEVTHAIAAGENVLPAGGEARAGDIVAEAGRRLRPTDLALIQSAGIRAVDVIRRPVVRIVCVGLADRETVSAMITAILNRDGCASRGVDHAGGDRDTLADLVRQGEADLVVTIGGTGAGGNDFAVDVLASIGDVAFHGVSLHPGESFAAGLADGCPVLMLPGLPLAAFIAAEFFAARAVRVLGGRDADWPFPCQRAILRRKIASRLGRVEFCRVTLDGQSANPIAVADGATLSTVSRADGFVLVPSMSEGFGAGDEVAVYLYQQRPCTLGTGT